MSMEFYLNNAPVPFSPGQTILEALRQQNIEITAPCGGKGRCGKCTVTVDGRQVLSCMTPAEEGMHVFLAEQGDVTAVLGNQSVLSTEDGGTGYGLAVDIGTTTVAMHLMDLHTGRTLASLGQANAQRPYGADVISRIQSYAEGHGEDLTRAIRNQLLTMGKALCLQAGISLEEVTGMTVAANTVMCHLLCGLDPAGIGRAPFTPESLFGGEFEIGLPFPVYVAPAVSGYVGGDITADILACGLQEEKAPVLIMDVGTNGEMALGCGNQFLCCSTAAGPAFEGDQLACGMTAGQGAIDRVELVDGAVQCTVIGGGPARGICGSGLLDALAVMLDLGIMDETGRMLDLEEDDIPDALGPLLGIREERPVFYLRDGVYISQSDVRKVQLGKGAMAAGIQVLLQKSGLDFGEIRELLLAGGFGSFIRPESAARIGLIPRGLLEKTRAVGNTAALGAKMALASQKARAQLADIQRSMTYLELSGMPEFNDAYIAEMMFPE